MIKRERLPIVKRSVIFQGRVIRLEKLKLRAPDQSVIQRELIRHRGAAVMIPVLPGERFVMVSQYRVAVNGHMLEFPAGTLEAGERPRACALRETVEEVGYYPRKLEKLADFYPAPGISTERMYLYLATKLVSRAGKQDDDEWIERHIVEYRDLKHWIESGRIKDGKTILGFFLYLRHKGRLKYR